MVFSVTCRIYRPFLLSEICAQTKSELLPATLFKNCFNGHRCIAYRFRSAAGCHEVREQNAEHCCMSITIKRSFAHCNYAARKGNSIPFFTTQPMFTSAPPPKKAITTGTVPNFVDVILNFGTHKLTIDSIVHQAHRRGGKIIFCGDDTWTKLFPTQFHRQLENQDSLYVNDFYEVLIKYVKFILCQT